MRTHFVGFSLLLFAAGCATSASEPSSSTNADTSAVPAWSQNVSTLLLDVAGSGDVPLGSACAPGSRSYAIDVEAQTLSSFDCVGSPLRREPRADFDLRLVQPALDAALSQLSAATTTSCEATPFVSGDIFRADETGASFQDDTHACGVNDEVEAIVGLPALLALIAPIVDQQPLKPIPPASASSAAFWPANSTQFTIRTSGSGPTPLGSQCTPGDDAFTVDVFPDGQPWLVTEQICTQADPEVDPSTPAYERVLRNTLDQDHQNRLIAALAAVPITATTTCNRDAPYASVNVLGAAVATYQLAGTGCSPADVGPFVDLTAVQGVLIETAYGGTESP